MFGSRRKRGGSNPPLNKDNANPNAAMAAAQAFLKNQASNTSLATAAAGAALRSRPTTPISVADVQTKRMIRRAESTSSMGSSRNGSTRGKDGPALRRRGSSGSMTERTFRDPSPSSPVPSAYDTPPVPALPKSIPQSKGHRRTSSLEAPAMRVASPAPNQANGRGSSLGPANTGSAPRRNGQRMQSSSSVPELTGLQKTESRGSVNFSLPTGSRPGSPILQRQLTSPEPQRSQPPIITSPANQHLVYDPNTRSFLPYADILAIEERERVRHASTLPVKKKKRLAPAKATGQHLSDGTMGSKPRGTAVDALEAKNRSEPRELPAPQRPVEPEPEPISHAEPLPATVVTKKKKKNVVVPSDADSDQESYIPNSSDNDSDFRAGSYSNKSRTQLSKKPSVVREEREVEEQEDHTPITPVNKDNTLTFSPTSLPRSKAGRGKGKASQPATNVEEYQVQAAPINITPPPSDSGLTTNESVKNKRVSSISPARSTHFAPTPDSLVVRHSPPGRSISPRKSALKHSNSPRDQSPMGDVSEVGSDDVQPLPRKKAVRVSFDDTNIIVGEAAGLANTDSPITQSPQVAKRNWFSLGGRNRKKESAVIGDNDDEVMQPRPALPSFGSVRGTNPRREPAEERPLVKPAEHAGNDTPIPSMPPSPLETAQGSEIHTPLGQSTDHLIGAVLSHDAASKHEANISKSREPLPPQVTSVEGTGYHSDTDSLDSVIAYSRPVDIASPSTVEPWPIVDKPNGDTPKISITAATPTIEESSEREQWLDMPGGFPASSASDSEGEDAAPISKTAASKVSTEREVLGSTPSPANNDMSHEVQQLGSPVLSTNARENSLQHVAILEETEDSDSSGIYSDAAEDLSDLEGGDFQSLDAVVENPVVGSTTPGVAISTPPESPTVQLAKQKAYQRSGLSKTMSQPDSREGWEKAQEYWRGLSDDKKHQLEQEAREAAAESESSIEVKPLPKPKKKKNIAVQPATAPILKQPEPQARQNRTYQIQPGTKASRDEYTPTLRGSMRGQSSPIAAAAPETHMRKSMRGQGSMRSSLREDQAPGQSASQRRNRPTSLPVTEIKPDSAAVKMHVRALSAASAAAATKASANQPPLLRRGSGDSDSSFKRSKPAEVTTFRRSMRVNKDQGSRRTQSPINSSRFSLRSSSPTGSLQSHRPLGGAPPASSPQINMRRSMRISQDSMPSLRGNKPARTKSPIRLPGFGRTSSTKPAKTKPVAPRSSRFADSSDEEDIRPAFRSRFADSSDEDDEPLPPRQGGFTRGTMRSSQPLRPIPARSGVNDGDSSDLPDSDDEKTPASPNMKQAKTRQSEATTSTIAPTSSLQRSGSGRGALAPTVTVNISGGARPLQARRGSLMSILRRKKPDATSKVRKSDVESAARRDTPLERSKSDLALVKRQESYNSTNGARPMSPKLQKRNNSASWPLTPTAPVTIDEDEKERPFSADAVDGVTGGDKPGIGTRRFTDSGLNAVDVGNVNGVVVPRKKKFQALRRMFKLDD
ncbi:hypothetical protein B0O99DRAFT_655932 [Bisporella sp. PMI_857]|nr:hypothetical protein B0O99DRAFT_655932 [Bisporella sp. PMI_857]